MAAEAMRRGVGRLNGPGKRSLQRISGGSLTSRQLSEQPLQVRRYLQRSGLKRMRCDDLRVDQLSTRTLTSTSPAESA